MQELLSISCPSCPNALSLGASQPASSQTAPGADSLLCFPFPRSWAPRNTWHLWFALEGDLLSFSCELLSVKFSSPTIPSKCSLRLRITSMLLNKIATSQICFTSCETIIFMFCLCWGRVTSYLVKHFSERLVKMFLDEIYI